MEKNKLDTFVKKYKEILQMEEDDLREVMKYISPDNYEEIEREIKEWLILRHS